MSGLQIEKTLSRLATAVPQVTPKDVMQTPRLMDAIKFDLRSPEAIADGKIPNARTVQQRYIELEIGSHGLKADTPIIVYCVGGRNSLFAAKALLDLGYSSVYSLAGGFNAWRDAEMPIEVPVQLSSAEQARYKRQLLLPKIGEDGQIKLKQARVAIIGAGGLGSPVAYYLAAAGVGYLRIIDDDTVDESNLQRQILHDTEHLGQPKVDSARAALQRFNPLITVEAVNSRLTADNAGRLLDGVEIVVDGSDNFATRYLVNDAIVANGQTLVSASVFQFSGQVATFAPHEGGACYACLFPEPTPSSLAPSCTTAGVLGAHVGVVGLLQALEVTKQILGIGERLRDKLLVFDGMTSTLKLLSFPRRAGCNACSPSRAPSQRALLKEECASNMASCC